MGASGEPGAGQTVLLRARVIDAMINLGLALMPLGEPLAAIRTFGQAAHDGLGMATAQTKAPPPGEAALMFCRADRWDQALRRRATKAMTARPPPSSGRAAGTGTAELGTS